MRILKVLCVLALAFSVTGLVYAETQSVKISGDLTVRSFMRNNYDLAHNHAENAADGVGDARSGNQDDWQTYFMSTTEVQIEADLTDNVMGLIRIANQRDWDVRTKNITVVTPVNGGYTANADEFSVDLDLAYVELKEFLYSPLTLRIGRQDIWFGKGFVIGRQQRDHSGNINAEEYTTFEAFDAIRATLDYDPWTIDVIASKIWENDIQSRDDVDLWGVNVGYIFDVFNAETEGYWFEKVDRSFENWNIKTGNVINTMGIRGSLDPIDNWTLSGETAWQWGQYVGSRVQTERRNRSAWALDVAAECRYFQQQYAWKPKLGVEYVFYSGNKNIKDESYYSDGTYTGWDIMYRGKYDSAIREFMGSYYATAQDANNVRGWCYYPYPDASYTNQHQVIVIGSIQPTDSLTVNARYINFWQQYKTNVFEANRTTTLDNTKKCNPYLGGEIDFELVWDYTEDVSFGLLSAWFFPGTHYYDQSDSIATDVVGSCKLSF